MADSPGDILDRVRNNRTSIFLGVMGLIALAWLLIWALWPSAAPEWTGFNQAQPQSSETTTSRTLWDWLQLCLLPLALMISAWWLGRVWQVRLERRFEVKAETSPEAGDEEGIYQEERLQAYFDLMTTLLLEKGLRESSPNDEVRRIAQAQTMTIIWGLNGERKGAVAQFLNELLLIRYPDPIISLAGANFSSAELSGTNLSRTDFRRSWLKNADLSEATLSNTDFTGADLTGADLSGALPIYETSRQRGWIPPTLNQANLSQAILGEANLAETDLTTSSMRGAMLRKADLHGAILQGVDLQDVLLDGANLRATNLNQANLYNANLKNAVLSGAKLIGAKLVKADLSGVDAFQANYREADLEQANLDGANFRQAYLYKSNLRKTVIRGANLQGANLSYADLTGADLRGADFRGAYLTGAKVTGEQLQQAFSLEGAILPDDH